MTRTGHCSQGAGAVVGAGVGAGVGVRVDFAMLPEARGPSLRARGAAAQPQESVAFPVHTERSLGPRAALAPWL